MDKNDSFLQTELEEWCQKAVVDPKHAVLLLGVPAELGVAYIEETVQAVKALGRVGVRDYKEGPTPGFLLVLCECKEVVDNSRLPVEEGKSVSDLQAMFSSPSSNAGSPEAIIRAVGELLEKTSKPGSDGSAYRRLRIFSGTVPTPAGEEALETWMDQARMMVMECECSEKEKR
ncbi:hypothetical protein QQF64_020384 [Cirrhinus molitorella]|uniref:Uncharacterized protein n=1 Tax=Cirrhinus molitorella TaxID=172907 RepID=A0ABR3L903_9TELE